MLHCIGLPAFLIARCTASQVQATTHSGMRHLCPGKAKSCGSLIKFNSCAKLFSRASRAVGAHAGPVSLDLFGGVTPERGFLPAHDPPPR